MSQQTISSPSTTTAEYLKGAVHHNSALTKQGMLERMFTFWFNSFVYNQIWEDPRVDAEALQLNENSRIMTISSGGCNVLNYLIYNPASVTAIDLNKNHICLLRLKLAAIKHLPSFEEFFLMFGHADDKANVDNYNRYIKQHLDPETRRFWEGGGPMRKLFLGPRIKYFTKNFYDYAKLGYFIRFLHLIAKVTRKDPAALMRATTKEEQEKVWKEEIEPFFNNWIVKTGGKLPWALYSLGIPPQQFQAMEDEVGGGGMIEVYRERIKRLAVDFPVDDNYFMWQAFGRTYDKKNRAATPDYLKEENWPKLRANVDRVSTHIVSYIEFLKQLPDNSLNSFIMLDSQDWMKPQQIADQWREVARVGAPGTRIIFRTAASDSPVETALDLVPDLKKRYVYEKDLSLELFKKDRSAIYGGFHLYVKP
ncbi:MAG: DUF3419 family protein [Candidatus Methylacidiphilales bacterium]|nr:BtaA family protein [Candidatus Methylacidiphilales bacterium]